MTTLLNEVLEDDLVPLTILVVLILRQVLRSDRSFLVRVMEVISKDIIDGSLTNVLHLRVLVSDVVVNDLGGHTLAFIDDQSFLHCSDLLKLVSLLVEFLPELIQVSILHGRLEGSLLEEDLEGIEVQL